MSITITDLLTGIKTNTLGNPLEALSNTELTELAKEVGERLKGAPLLPLNELSGLMHLAMLLLNHTMSLRLRSNQFTEETATFTDKLIECINTRPIESEFVLLELPRLMEKLEFLSDEEIINLISGRLSDINYRLNHFRIEGVIFLVYGIMQNMRKRYPERYHREVNWVTLPTPFTAIITKENLVGADITYYLDTIVGDPTVKGLLNPENFTATERMVRDTLEAFQHQYGNRHASSLGLSNRLRLIMNLLYDKVYGQTLKRLMSA